ncbi:MAG: gluconate 2-dehydrogenase subunit 3 family protein [Gemmatimonadales bacterium]
MLNDPTSRRAFLAAAGAAGMTWLLADLAAVEEAVAHAAHAGGQVPRPAFENLSAADAADLEALMSRIIPSDDGPGAKEAGAIYFLDKSLGTFMAPQKDQVTGAVVELRKQAAARWAGNLSLAALTPAQLDELLKSVEQGPIFGQIRFLTICGTFANSSWGGNRDEVGWKLLGHEMKPMFQPPFGYYDAQPQGRS